MSYFLCRHIILENNENKPVTFSRDTQEILPEKGKEMLKIFHNFKHKTSLFDDFEHYEFHQEKALTENAKKAENTPNNFQHKGNFDTF